MKTHAPATVVLRLRRLGWRVGALLLCLLVLSGAPTLRAQAAQTDNNTSAADSIVNALPEALRQLIPRKAATGSATPPSEAPASVPTTPPPAPAATASSDPLPVPALSDRIIDQTGTLTPDQLSSLRQQLEGIEKTYGSQVVILMVPTTLPEPIEMYANRVASTWKIGRKDIGDGLLLVVAKQDHRLRIEVARTLEGAIPDVIAWRIIDQQITPRFKADDFAGGLSAGVTAIRARIAGENLPPPQSTQRAAGEDNGFDFSTLIVFLLFAVPLFGRAISTIFGNKLGALISGGLLGFMGWHMSGMVWVGVVAGALGAVVALFFLSHSLGAITTGGTPPRGRNDHFPGGFGGGFGGGGGGGSSGGGMSSGGGGGFGGGGSSGSW